MKLLAIVIVGLFLGALFASPFNLLFGMDTHHGMVDCPFMSHDEAVCPMTFGAQLGAWKGVFMALVPVVFLLGLYLLNRRVSRIVSLLFKRRRLRTPVVALRIYLERTYTYTLRSLQEQFSNGILNPKLY